MRTKEAAQESTAAVLDAPQKVPTVGATVYLNEILWPRMNERVVMSEPYRIAKVHEPGNPCSLLDLSRTHEDVHKDCDALAAAGMTSPQHRRETWCLCDADGWPTMTPPTRMPAIGENVSICTYAPTPPPQQHDRHAPVSKPAGGLEWRPGVVKGDGVGGTLNIAVNEVQAVICVQFGGDEAAADRTWSWDHKSV